MGWIAIVGRDDRGSHCGTGIVADHHRKTLGDPLGRADPHNWRRALNLDDPELEFC